MNLGTCGIVYFPCTDSLLHNRSKQTLLADLRSQRIGDGSGHRSFTLPKHLPYESLSYRALKIIVALYRNCFYSHHSFIVEITLKQLADEARISERHAGLALKELHASRLVDYQKVWHSHTKIVLLDPERRSGVPLSQLGHERMAEFESQPAWYWYDLLLYGGKGVIHAPQFPSHEDARDMNRVTVVAECPLRRRAYSEDGGVEGEPVPCSGLVSSERKKFRITFHRDGTDRWHCYRCGHGGTCQDLWIQLHERFRREQANPPLYVVVGHRTTS
jgi:hypothetical protein